MFMASCQHATSLSMRRCMLSCLPNHLCSFSAGWKITSWWGIWSKGEICVRHKTGLVFGIVSVTLFYDSSRYDCTYDNKQCQIIIVSKGIFALNVCEWYYLLLYQLFFKRIIVLNFFYDNFSFSFRETISEKAFDRENCSHRLTSRLEEG